MQNSAEEFKQNKKMKIEIKELIASLHELSHYLGSEIIITGMGEKPEQVEALLQSLSEDLSKICKKYAGLDIKKLIQ